jgi:hypothetical protein
MIRRLIFWCGSTPHRRFRTAVIVHRTRLVLPRRWRAPGRQCGVGCGYQTGHVMQTTLPGLCDRFPTATAGQDCCQQGETPDPIHMNQFSPLPLSQTSATDRRLSASAVDGTKQLALRRPCAATTTFSLNAKASIFRNDGTIPVEFVVHANQDRLRVLL